MRLDIKRQLSSRSDRVKSVSLHPTEPWMLATLYNGTVNVWNYETQTLGETLERRRKGRRRKGGGGLLLCLNHLIVCLLLLLPLILLHFLLLIIYYSVKTFEVCDLPVRSGCFVLRKNWIVTGSVCLSTSLVSVLLLLLNYHASQPQDDFKISVYNYNTMEKVHAFEAHSDYVRSVAVSAMAR
mgnify:CR=1 FL=1